MRRWPVILLALAAAVPSAATAQRVEATSEDYAVYRTAIAALLAVPSSRNLPAGPTVVATGTLPLPGEATFHTNAPRTMGGMDPSTMEGVRATAGKSGHVLADSLGLPGAVRELSPQAYDSTFVATKDFGVAWRRFHERFGMDAVRPTLSRVGFNRDHTQAVVQVDRQCAGLCGYARTFRMHTQDGRWSVERTLWSTSY